LHNVKRFCSIQEIRKKIEENWIQFININSKELGKKNFSGSSPPSVFVGHKGYPKILVGPMVPPIHGNTSILDYPEKWVGKSIDEIARFRSLLVRGVYNIDVHRPFGKYIESLQELAMANMPAESEIVFEKTPIVNIEQKNFDADYLYGLVAPLKNFKTYSSISIDKRIENTFYDKDLNSAQSILKLYENRVEISKINRTLSMGMLGLKKNRKLVPTRWSISATDDIISANLTKKIENYPNLELYEVHQYHHLGNYYSIIFIPQNNWIFEMQEAWINNNGNTVMGIDYEDKKKINHCPSLAGAFFAARLAVSEYLDKIKKNAAVLVLREIHPDYAIPVGVWQVREGIRNATKEKIAKSESFDKAISYACTFMSISKKEWLKNSKIYKNIKEQRKILDYVHF
jgi:DNA repair protein NreA